ncbi:MAG: 16S rRNA (uracil(1498)-N(3))-methyltransferase [Armatimonadetes bacterium]|nr:16S rRNA (uracil(1498)-N(3))-methyltransferase [Armatimonadota bacterium]
MTGCLMTVPRLLVPAERLASGEMELTGAEARYLARVLRLGPGERFRVFTAEGDELEAEITQLSYRRVTARLLGPANVPDTDPKHDVTVALAILKGNAMDWAIQKLAEVGARAIIPLSTERVVVRASDWQEKTARWQEIASEAARKSGRRRPPEVRPVTPVAFLPEQFQDCWRHPWLLLDPDAKDAMSVPKAVADADAAGLIIGPEGDLTDEEKRLLLEGGARPVYLGPRVLRAETAAVVACALALYALGELGPAG